MLRISRYGLVAVIAASTVSSIVFAAVSGTAQAHGWPYHSLDGTMARVKGYLSKTYQNARYSVKQRRGSDGVLVMKLGMGIAYCKGHAATIGVREGKYFRPIAITRTLRGVRARNIGLMATRLAPGTYYIVHARCHVNGRTHNVGLPLRRPGRPRLYRTSYAKFTIQERQVLNAGFLRFFPSRRGRLKIKLQSVPRRDIRFLAARFPGLHDELDSRLMSRTNAGGYALNARGRSRQKRVPVRKARVAAPVRSAPNSTYKSNTPPLIRTPNTARKKTIQKIPTKPLASKSPVVAPAVKQQKNPPPRVETLTKKAQGSTMTQSQRRAACTALLQLKREGKVRQLPVTCLRFGLHKDNAATGTGLPPVKGPDK